MCAIAGAFNTRKAAEKVFSMGHVMQHRAKEFTGIVASDGRKLSIRRGRGIVQDVFTQNRLDALHGKNAIIHLRYSTVKNKPGARVETLVQPLISEGVALAHNGNLKNYRRLIKKMAYPEKLKTEIDSEAILRLLVERKPRGKSPADLAKDILASVIGAKGSYSLLLMLDDIMVAVRDPSGNRPLSLGKTINLDGTTAWYVASETVAFDNLGIEFVRDIDPGEILIITKAGLHSFYFAVGNKKQLFDKLQPGKRAYCIFELLYYCHPGSNVFGISAVLFRRACGDKLCQKYPPRLGTKKDRVIFAVPDSANEHGKGFAARAKSMLETVLTRNHYVGRTFIGANQFLRDLEVIRKFIIMKIFVIGKYLVLIDDSIVRMTTAPAVIRLLRLFGVKGIEGRIPTPPIIWPCHYGINIPTKKELCAANMTKKEIAEACGLDNLEFLTVEDIKTLVPNPEDFCFDCMTGERSI